MASMLTRTHAPPGGPRVRLRLARRSDAGAVRELLEDRGVTATELDLQRLLTYDPTRRTVICAFAPLDGSETLVGIGAIRHDDDEPETLVAARGIGSLLARVLRERAESHRRRVA